MTCTITIDPLRGAEENPEQGITVITVSGIAENCRSVSVSINQTQPVSVTTPNKQTNVINNQWDVEFSVAENDFSLGDFLCGSGNKYVVEVKCSDGENECKESFDGDAINCGNCPEVELIITPNEECIRGRRMVNIRGIIRTEQNQVYTWYFGTDEDNQIGEDSQVGNGLNEFWLPAANADGNRIVEVNHVYEPSGDQEQEVTVSIVTSSGPGSYCRSEASFTLEPCECDLTVMLRLLDQQAMPLPSFDCLPAGSYILEVISPASGSANYAWSVDGQADNSQTSSKYRFSMIAGEEKTISVFVSSGACTGSNAFVLLGCEDCSNYEAQLAVFDSNRRDVTNENCLPVGNYTVQALSPQGQDNRYQWSLNNVVDRAEIDSSISVNLAEDSEQLVTLEVNQRDCRDVASVNLRNCQPASDIFIPCMMFKVLALIGVGLFFLGAILTSCPASAMPMPAPVAIGIGVSLMLGGGALALLGAILWTVICEPSECDWLAFLWQTLVLLGVLMIYAGFCPGCVWMLSGIGVLIIGCLISIYWGNNCDISSCRVLAEWISLFTFVVNIVVVIEFILASCVITTRPIAALIWGITIAAFQAWLWYEANRKDCIRS